jgi:hypothetical protein
MKKIIAIISGSLVAILLTVTIILACTQFTATNVVNSGAYSIEVYKGSSTVALDIHKDYKEYDEIMKKYNASLKENNLSSLFQGAKGWKAEVKPEEVTISNITSNESTYVLRFIYDEEQTLKLNGKNYIDEETDNEITYTCLYVVVNNSANYEDYKVYLANGNATKSYYNVNLIAHQSGLYEYIGGLKYLYQ